jgi:hypothetical protein
MNRAPCRGCGDVRVRVHMVANLLAEIDPLAGAGLTNGYLFQRLAGPGELVQECLRIWVCQDASASPWHVIIMSRNVFTLLPWMDSRAALTGSAGLTALAAD